MTGFSVIAPFTFSFILLAQTSVVHAANGSGAPTGPTQVTTPSSGTSTSGGKGNGGGTGTGGGTTSSQPAVKTPFTNGTLTIQPGKTITVSNAFNNGAASTLLPGPANLTFFPGSQIVQVLQATATDLADSAAEMNVTWITPTNDLPNPLPATFSILASEPNAQQLTMSSSTVTTVIGTSQGTRTVDCQATCPSSMSSGTTSTCAGTQQVTGTFTEKQDSQQVNFYEPSGTLLGTFAGTPQPTYTVETTTSSTPCVALTSPPPTTSGGSGGGNGGGSCTIDSQCASGNYCNLNLYQCAPGTTGVGASCTINSQCPAGDYCALNTYTCTIGVPPGSVGTSCTIDAQCSAGNYCNLTFYQCAPGSSSLGASCTIDAQCEAGYYCNVSTYTCSPGASGGAGSSCTIDAQCPAGYTCNLFQCTL